MLAHHGVKPTYYASGGFCGQLAGGLQQYGVSDLQAAHEAGHEIGCHTYDHVSGLRCSIEDHRASVEKNKRFVEERIPGLTMRSFACPFGHAPLGHRRRVLETSTACRGVGRASNGPTVDRTLLIGVGLVVRQRRLHSLERFVEEAAERRLWLILFTHDVSERPSDYGCAPSDLDAALRLAKAARLDVSPVRAMLPHLTACPPPSGPTETPAAGHLAGAAEQ